MTNLKENYIEVSALLDSYTLASSLLTAVNENTKYNDDLIYSKAIIGFTEL